MNMVKNFAVPYKVGMFLSIYNILVPQEALCSIDLVLRLVLFNLPP